MNAFKETQSVALRCVPACVAVLAVTNQICPAAESFEVEVPSGFAAPINLRDGRLFSLDRATIGALISSNGGRTWKNAGPLLDRNGRPIAGEEPGRAYLLSVIRLASGAIGVKFELPQPQAPGPPARLRAYFTRSIDEARTWSEPIQITWSHTPANATWIIQTRKGRLVLPNEYWRTQPDDRGIGLCTAFWSDDEGTTWRESRDSLWVWENGGAWQGACEVPCVAETADGRLIMFMRTWYQRIAQSYSTDGGRTWSPAKLNDLVSSNSEAFLTPIPSTGELLCIWNQAGTQEIKTGYYRARLSSAISKDSGKSWAQFRTVAMSPGQKDVRRITDPGPAAFLRTPVAVPTQAQMRGDAFHMNRAPRVSFVGGQAYLVYTHRRYTYVENKLERVYNHSRMRVMPVDWFYEQDR